MMQKKKLGEYSRSCLITYAIVIAAFIVVNVMKSMGMVSSMMNGLLVPICAYIVLAISLNLTVGILGELSLGHAGFMSVGCFTGVLIAQSMVETIPFAPARLALAMIAGALIAGIAGIIIGVPALRLKGDYLAIVTLAFGEIIKNLMQCVYVGKDVNGLHFGMKDQMSLGMDAASGKMLINGPMGTVSVAKIASFTSGFVLIIITLFLVFNFINSRTGRAVMALRDNRIAAESVGINATKVKLIAFLFSAMLAGAAGALYGLNYSSIGPAKFDYNTSILILVFVVLGGIGNMRGSIIAATLLTVLPELLREFSEYRMLAYAILLIVMMLINNSKFKKNLMEKSNLKQLQRKEAAAAARKEASENANA
ncbi:MAG: branched-chain amino acid ABC transporter permease [Butyricicoccus sp.]|nr:branched-chain amino acid ABC transporter permease [Butyricicoccus sp.]MBQ8586216.1 branched-chain amino acid ABC transporter permease [Butyricicoccus sp.]